MHGWCYAVKPEKMHECIRIFKEVNAPFIAARPDSIGHRWVDQTSDQATCVPFWKNEADEEAIRAHIPRLVEDISHVLASGEAYQKTFEVVHEQHPTEPSE